MESSRKDRAKVPKTLATSANPRSRRAILRSAIQVRHEVETTPRPVCLEPVNTWHRRRAPTRIAQGGKVFPSIHCAFSIGATQKRAEQKDHENNLDLQTTGRPEF